MNLTEISIEIKYIITLFVVLFLPKILLRFRIPSGLTALFLGILCTQTLGWFQDSQVLLLLSRLGITSLFVFAGMEIDLKVLAQHKKPLLKSLANSILLIIFTALIINLMTGLSIQISLISAIAIFTPSAGFILSSLKYYKLNEEEVFWIKLKAIAKEIAAVLILFIALKLDNPFDLIKTTTIFGFGVLVLTPLFKIYLNKIAPYAPKSEVSFLVLISFIFGVIAKKLGTYYLVGAFAVGIVAGQFNFFTTGKEAKRIEDSLQSFYNIFIPFYFFSTGLIVTSDFFTLPGLWVGIALVLTIIPIRILSVVYSIKFFLPEFWNERGPISVALVPNLIFGLVVMSILKTEFLVPNLYLSGILIYTIVASLIPAFYFEQSPPIEYDSSRVNRS
jgi:Kef-type K+ transport system membrane component KefB